MTKTRPTSGQIYVLLLSILLSLGACQVTKPDLGKAADYLPDRQLMMDGIVNKYYFHALPKDGYNPSTIIEYRAFLLKNPNELTINLYNAAFELTRSSTYALDTAQVVLSSMTRVFRYDTLAADIMQPVYYDWETSTATTEINTKYPGGTVQSVVYTRQLGTDTLLEDRPVKQVHRAQKATYFIGDEIRNETEAQIVEYYAPGIGLFSYESKYPEGTSWLELVEQIPYANFLNMARHDVKRVAYIDPATVMDQNSDFSLCDKQEKVVDYYNGQLDRAGYRGGKRALREAIDRALDPGKIQGASGLLTFRFVINCQGEAGWFITEQADFEYQQKTFPAKTVQHLYGIIAELDQWRPCKIRGKTYDSYYYLTFKIEDGVIIELLP